MAAKNITFNWNDEVSKIIQALHSNDNIEFCYYTEKSKYALVSKVKQKIKLVSSAAFIAKTAQVYFEEYGEYCPLIEQLSSKDEGDLARELRNSLYVVDEFTHYPHFVQAKDEKIKDIDGFKIYNQYNEDKNILDLKELAKELNPIEKVEEMDFRKYPEITFLIKYLTNDSVNQGFDYNNETGKYDKAVKLSHKLVHWMSALINTNKKLALSWVFQSKVHGVGKGVIKEELLQYLVGEDFFTPINVDTVIKTNNKAIDNKSLCILEECEIEKKAEKIKFNSNMKDWITEEQILMREMQVDQRKVRNYSNFMIFTNSDTPFQIETNCRRYAVCKTPNLAIKAAVQQNFGIGMDEFIQRIRRQRNDFLLDLIRLEFDLAFVYNNAPMTVAKKNIILRTNTLANIASNYILTNNQEELRSFLLEMAEIDMGDVDLICEEVNAGILSTENVDRLYQPLRGVDPEFEKNITSKNSWFAKLFGDKKTKVTISSDGKPKEIRCFKFAHYNKKRLEAIYNKDMFDLANITSFDDEDDDVIDLSSFKGGF